MWRPIAVVAGLVLAVGFATPGYAAAGVHCGDTITTDTSLRTDLFCTGDGLVVGAGDLVIDLKGHTIHGSGTGAGVRYADASAPHVDADVVNGTVTGFATGIALSEGDSGVLVKSMRLVGNDAGITGSLLSDVQIRGGEITGGATAVAADGSTGVLLASVRVTGGRVLAFNGSDHWVVKGSTFNDSDIDFVEATDSTVLNSRLTDTDVEVFQSNRVTVLNNDLVNSTVTYSSGFDGVVRGNRFSGRASGFSLDDSSGDTTLEVERNTFTGSSTGVHVVQDSLAQILDLTISYNTFDGNGAAGVYLATTGRPGGTISIHDNTFTGNGFTPDGLVDPNGLPVDDGLHVSVPFGGSILVAANHTSGNADHGIEALPAGTVIDGGANTSTMDPAGCAGVVCT